MGFKFLSPAEWPCIPMREFVAVLNVPFAIEGLLSNLSQEMLGTDSPFIGETFADILVAAGLFPSKGQANKAGANTTDIPDGLSVFCIGKLRTFVWVWKPIKSEETNI